MWRLLEFRATKRGKAMTGNWLDALLRLLPHWCSQGETGIAVKICNLLKGMMKAMFFFKWHTVDLSGPG